MNILGIAYGYHDAAAALVVDDRLAAAAQEERFTRTKHDPAYPENAIAFCLEQAGMSTRELDAVVYYERPYRKFNRIIESAASSRSKGPQYLSRLLPRWLSEGKLNVIEKISKSLSIPPHKIHTVEHHQAHAAVAFYTSPFENATVLTVDGVGEYETVTVSRGDASGLHKLFSLNLPDSLGLFYSAFTAFLGFTVNSGEYKVMGMAGFGEPSFVQKVQQLYHLTSDGGFKIHAEYFEFLCPSDLSYTDKFLELFGKPRLPESPFRLAPPGVAPEPGSIEHTSRHFADIAASLQFCLEEILAHLAKSAIHLTGIADLCIAGGVGLNASANGKLLRSLPGKLYVHPASGDAGCALGAALYHHHASGGGKLPQLTNLGLGKEYPHEETLALLESQGVTEYKVFEDSRGIIEELASRLAVGQVIGWVQGRFEWGPRALGYRSILANPALPKMQETVNLKIKFREPFRPFAPSVLAHEAQNYFDLPESSLHPLSPEHFMIAVAPVRADKKALIPAVVHADGTSRVHLVEREANPLYADLIEAFFRRTGIPLLLNTSFNLSDEPIVSSPFNALRSFYRCDMDCLALGRILVLKDN